MKNTQKNGFHMVAVVLVMLALIILPSMSVKAASSQTYKVTPEICVMISGESDTFTVIVDADDPDAKYQWQQFYPQETDPDKQWQDLKGITGKSWTCKVDLSDPDSAEAYKFRCKVNEIPSEEARLVVLPKAENRFTEGEGQTINPDAGDSLSFKTDASEIKGVIVDHIADPEFTFKDGIVSISQEYLKQLSDGEHTLMCVTSGYRAFATTFVVSRGHNTSASTSAAKACMHPNMGWDVVREATDTDDGEMKYRCPDCGYVSEVRPITAYWQFNVDAAKSIAKAKAGETVAISTPLFVSFHHSVIEQLQKRTDVSVVLSYKYQGKNYKTTIPAGADLTGLIDRNGFTGFLQLAARFGQEEVTK